VDFNCCACSEAFSDLLAAKSKIILSSNGHDLLARRAPEACRNLEGMGKRPRHEDRARCGHAWPTYRTVTALLLPCRTAAMDPTGYIVAAIFGAILTGGFSIILNQIKERNDRRALASAVAAEISGIVNNVKTRGLDGYFRALVPLLQSDTPPAPPWAHFNAQHDSCPVYKAYLAKLGILGPHLSGRVVRFYALFEAVRTEIIILASGAYDAEPKKAAKLVERALTLWDQIEPLALPLIADLFALSGERPD
jgi:hypothetical protein